MMGSDPLPPDHDDVRVDGRSLRRERNVSAVIDAVLAMFEDETLTPTIERAAERSGLSLRSVYRYFPDADSLTQAAIDEMWRRGQQHAHRSSIGQGPIDERVLEFAEMRVRLYELVGPSFRAGRLRAPSCVQIRDDLERVRRTLTDQFELQFRPEIDALSADVRPERARRRGLAGVPGLLHAHVRDSVASRITTRAATRATARPGVRVMGNLAARSRADPDGLLAI